MPSLPQLPHLPRFGALCLLLLLREWQLLALAPLRYTSGRGARLQRALTSLAMLRFLALLALSPLMLQQSVALYDATNVRTSPLFRRIALATMAGDLAISLTILGNQIWQRKRLRKLLNGLRKLQHEIQLSWLTTLLLWAKLALSLYELLCNAPFLLQNATHLPGWQLFSYSLQLYVQHVSSVFGNGIFAALLLILAQMERLELKWQHLYLNKLQHFHLLRCERKLLQVCADFIAVFQLGIFLLVIGNFINILANMYAYMFYFVEQHGIPLTISNYCLIVAIQLYAVIFTTHLCQLRHERLRSCCLELSYSPPEMTREQAALPTPLLFWPLEPVKFSVLGLFNLDNAFWLFLVSYAANYIVIILQFTLEHIKR